MSTILRQHAEQEFAQELEDLAKQEASTWLAAQNILQSKKGRFQALLRGDTTHLKDDKVLYDFCESTGYPAGRGSLTGATDEY